MVWAVTLATALLLVDLAALGWLYAWRWTETRRGWIAVGPARRAVRWWRALGIRAALWFPSWPHLVERLLGGQQVPVGRTPASVFTSTSGAVLFRYAAPTPRRGRPVLVVHAVVTRPWILDLLPGRSLVESLVADGRDVFLLDWGDPGALEAQHGLATKTAMLRDAQRFVRDATGGDAVHVVAYCTGATVALIEAAQQPDGPRASLTLIAPPVDTAVPGGMGTVLRQRRLMPVLLLDEDGCVPAAAVRESFHVLRPEALQAARSRWRTRRDPGQSETAAALTRWAWEQRPLPGRMFFDLIDYYRDNPFLTAPLGDQLRELTTPTLVAVTDRDHIVPIASSLALTRLMRKEPTVVRCAGGHVSMLMGHEARTVLYPAILDWLDDHDRGGRRR